MGADEHEHLVHADNRQRAATKRFQTSTSTCDYPKIILITLFTYNKIMGIIKFLKWLADYDPIKEQKSMVDAAKFEVERLKRNIEDVKRGSNSASTLKELRQKLKQARERLAYEKERLKRLKNKG